VFYFPSTLLHEVERFPFFFSFLFFSLGIDTLDIEEGDVRMQNGWAFSFVYLSVYNSILETFPRLGAFLTHPLLGVFFLSVQYCCCNFRRGSVYCLRGGGNEQRIDSNTEISIEAEMS